MKTVLIFIFLAVFTIEVQASDYDFNERLFPLPDEIKANVDFWVDIYSKYDKNNIIIHDDKSLDIIYEVLDMDSLFGYMKTSGKEKWEKIEKTQNDYSKALEKLSKRKSFESPALLGKELAVYALFNEAQDRKIYSEAALQVRSQRGMKEEFENGIKRSGKYMEQAKNIFEQHQLPLELTALPHVESSFNNRAYSKYGAAGMWQFTRATGKQYLKIDYSVDERFDPEMSTIAAARLLKRNYTILKSWPLALTAYNHGVSGMKRAVRKMRTRDIGAITVGYESRSFKFASRNFYAEFLAALHVSSNSENYFGELEYEKPEEYRIIRLSDYTRASTLIDRLNVDIEDIKKLNPSLRGNVLASKRSLPKGYQLRLPVQKAAELKEISDGVY